MSKDEWISVCDRLPRAEDGDAQSCVLVWHELSGALIYRTDNIHHNRYITHWMKLPGKPTGEQKDG